ncbi:MAG: protein BatD [Colwellia sp.]|nr:protein BatD [Colwellia sp.]
MSNESIVLTVIADDSVSRDALDTSPLLADFIIARTEVSSQTSMVNFKTTRTTRWQIVLIPRKRGNLIIPALTINGYQSQVINVQVIEQGSTGSAQQQDIFISAELSANDVYVQQLVTLTIKLHIGVQLQRGSLTEPSLTGAAIEQIGKDQENEGIVNGKRYRIIERTYAITPEQSGEFILNTPMFSGDVLKQSQRRSGFLSFGETKPVNVLGDKLKLNVRPIPPSYPVDANNSWLPSELLTLHQEWQPVSAQGKSEFTVGEPITRTITLTAAGLGKAQLPKIIMNAPAGLKVYPDQAQLHANLTKERLISQKRQNFALVASHAGDYVLPKISIAWWNTVTNKYQQAVLPEQTITVKANADAPLLPIENTTNAPLALPQNTVTPLTAPIIIEKHSSLQWLFLALWLLTCVAWALHVINLKRSGTAKVSKTKMKSVSNHYLALMAACKQNNAEQALNLVLPWLNNLVPQGNVEISTLSEAIMQINNTAFTGAIDEVQQHLYGKESTNGSWQGKSLLIVIQQMNASGIKSDHSSQFTLNPS